MSDSIEAPSSFALPRADASEATTRQPRGWPLPSRADLVRVLQALYALFWGLLAAVFGSAYLMMPLSRPLPGLVLLLGGMLACLGGARRLNSTRLYPAALEHQQRIWRMRTTTLLWLSILIAYFSVIFVLWREVRPNLYLVANVIAFFLTFAAFLVALNFVVPPLAHVLSRQQLALEAQVFAAANIGMIMLPLLATIGYVLVAALSTKPDSPMAAVHAVLYAVQDLMSQLTMRLNYLVMGVVLLPFSLTLALLWAAKDSAIRVLAEPQPAPVDSAMGRQHDRP